tara:strand:+ start:53 stop:541 length:489 start_codon:yes stop_codon:yes gene_type:complete
MKNSNSLTFKKQLNINDGSILYGSHFYCLKVFYEDTDAGGIVYHANYLKFFERARTSLLNCLMVNQYELLKNKGLRFVLREIFLKITDSFKLNDLVLIETRHKYAKNSCIYLEQFAWSMNDDFRKDILKVKSDIQIIMIDNKKKVKNIRNILSHPFFDNINK